MSDPTIPAGMKAYGPAHPDYPNAPRDHAKLGLPVRRNGSSAVGLDWRHHAPDSTRYPFDIVAYPPALSTPTTPDEGLSPSDERDLAEMIAAWRSSLANPASWMERLRALLAPSTEIQSAAPAFHETGGLWNVEAIREAAQFLSDRLDQLEWMDDDLAATCRDYFGHVEPAHERLKALLAKGER